MTAGTPSADSPSADSPSTTFHASRWQVRIADASYRVLGSGVLISNRHVLTCAHVLGRGPVKPAGPFVIEFPRSASGASVPARIPADGWLPQLTTGQRDIAILEFDHELADDVEPAKLGKGLPCIGNPARVFGHPATIRDGVWTHGQISDTTGPHGEWVQLAGRLAMHNERIERGFSGGGVLDEVSNSVVGIVVAAYEPLDRQAAWMIPMEVVAGYWLRLQDWLSEPSSVDDELDDAAVAEMTAVFARFRALAAEDRRQQVADLLPSDVQARLPRRPSSVPAVVRVCRRRVHTRLLANLVRYFEGPSPWSGELEAALARHGVGDVTTTAEQPDVLTPEDERRLYHALLRLPRFQNARSRHAYLDLLQARLRDERHLETRLSRSDDAPTDARALIAACLPIPGSLRLFVDGIPNADRDDTGFGELLLLVEALCPERLLIDDERDELVVLLRDVPAGLLAEAHRHAAPVAGPRGDLTNTDAERLVRRIESYAQSPDRPPRILTFTEHLARQLPMQRDALQRWGDRTAARLRFYRDDVARVRRAMRELPRSTTEPVLVIQLMPDAIDSDRYLLTITLEDGIRPQRPLAVVDEPEPLPSIVERVDRLFGEGHLFRLLDFDTERLTVEMILPRSLITEPVDQWPVSDILPAAIGTRFPVVLRSFERLRHDALRPQWRTKWRLAKHQGSADVNAMHYVPANDPASATEVRARLLPEDKLILVLGAPPPPQRALKPHDAYAGALSAGVAYIVWIRDAALADTFRQTITEALDRAPVRELPGEITAWRRDPGSATLAMLGKHTSVVVCDEDRVPVQFIGRDLRPPAKRGQP